MVLLLYSSVFLYVSIKLRAKQMVYKGEIFIKMHITWFLQTTFQYGSLLTRLNKNSINTNYI